jgi:hypothetical protein
MYGGCEDKQRGIYGVGGCALLATGLGKGKSVKAKGENGR